MSPECPQTLQRNFSEMTTPLIFSLSRRVTVHCWVFRITRALLRHVLRSFPSVKLQNGDVTIRKCHRRRRGVNGRNVSFVRTIPLNVWHEPDVSADALGPVTTNCAPTTRLGLVYKTPKGSTPLTSTLIRGRVHQERKPLLPSVAGSRIPSSRSSLLELCSVTVQMFTLYVFTALLPFRYRKDGLLQGCATCSTEEYPFCGPMHATGADCHLVATGITRWTSSSVQVCSGWCPD